CQQRSSYPLTF
nr:immunoglobulin light chain junction region [Mus musculus]